MYTITINNDEPIICIDYGIHNRNGIKILYMSFDGHADVSMKLDNKDSVAIKYNE